MKLHENSEVFSELVAAAAERIGLPEIYVEKDYWVTKALKHLSESNYAKDAVFKGGTSLSKAYRLIDRFSEDIDLAIFAGDRSRNAQKKLIKNIEKTVTQGLLTIEDDERIKKSEKYRRTVHQYPRQSHESDFGQASSDLLIEVNSFTTPEPCEEKELQTFIASALHDLRRPELIDKYELHSFKVLVLSVRRTLVEKILGVIKDSHADDPLEALSRRIRHLYDICLILKQKEHRDFVAGDDFSVLCDVCIEDERILFPKTAGMFDTPLLDAPIFSRFAEWRPALEATYNSTFKSLVYRDLPHMDEIEETINLIAKNIKRL